MSDSVYPEIDSAQTTPNDTQFAQVVSKAYRDASKFKEPIQKKWNYHFRLLNGNTQDDFQVKTWRTNRFVNMVRVASILLKSRFYQGMPEGQAEGRTLEAQLNQDNMNNVLAYDQERGKLPKELGNVIDDGINYACGVLFEGWRQETTDTIPRTHTFIQKMIAMVRKIIPKFKESQILYDGPEFRWVDPWTFFWDPNGTDVEDCAFCGEAVDMSIYQMRKNPSIDPEVINQVMSLQKEIMSTDKSRDAEDRLLALGLNKPDVSRVYGKIKEGLHEVVEYWGTYDIEGDGKEVECHGIVIDSFFVGCKEENPYWHGKKPYSKWDFNTVPGFFVGYSLVDQAAQSQEEMNDITNQSGDIRKLTAKPLIKMRLGADIEPEQISFAPGAIIPVEQMDDLEFYQPNMDALSALLNTLKYEREVFQLLTGMNDVALGQQDVGIGDNTATGAAIAQEQTELRYKAAAIGLDLFMERVGEMLMWNEQQFRSRKEVVPVRDKAGTVDYKQIAPKDLSGLFSYRMISSSLSQQTSTMKVNNLLKVLQVTNGNPAYNSAPVIDQIIKELGIDPNTMKQAGPDGSGNAEMDQVQKFAALPPDQQQAALAKMSPEDQQLMMKALQLIGPQNANPQSGGPAPAPVQNAPVQGPAPAIPAPAAPVVAGMGANSQ